MKNFMKKVVVTLTAVLTISSMVVGTSAVSTAGTSCAGNSASANVYSVSTSTNSSGCLTGIDVNSLLGKLNSLDNTTPINNASNCNTAGTTSKCTSAANAVQSYLNTAKQNSNCTTAQTGSNCTNETSVQSAATANTANCNGGKCATSNCETKSACATTKCAIAGEPCGVFSSNVTSGKTNSTFINRLNGALAKCGLDNKKFSLYQTGSNCIPAPSAGTTPTAKPAPSAGATPTAKPAPSAGATPTAKPAPSAGATPTAKPVPSAGTTPTASPAPSAGATPTATPAPSANNGNIDNQSFEQQVVSLVNEQRAANGLAPLTLSTQLSNVARTKSQDMHDNKYFSHTSPTYGSPFDMLKAFGISYRTAGENIAMGYATPQAVMTGWMNSAGHRANILNASFTQIGVGYVASGNYWTQEFIG